MGCGGAEVVGGQPGTAGVDPKFSVPPTTSCSDGSHPPHQHRVCARPSSGGSLSAKPLPFGTFQVLWALGRESRGPHS